MKNVHFFYSHGNEIERICPILIRSIGSHTINGTVSICFSNVYMYLMNAVSREEKWKSEWTKRWQNPNSTECIDFNIWIKVSSVLPNKKCGVSSIFRVLARAHSFENVIEIVFFLQISPLFSSIQSQFEWKKFIPLNRSQHTHIHVPFSFVLTTTLTEQINSIFRL